MSPEEIRATILSCKAYVEESEEKLRIVRLELAAMLLDMAAAQEHEQDVQAELEGGRDGRFLGLAPPREHLKFPKGRW